MDDSKLAKRPMHSTCTLGRDEESKKVEKKVYIGMIGSLIYWATSKPAILFSVSLCSRF